MLPILTSGLVFSFSAHAARIVETTKGSSEGEKAVGENNTVGVQCLNREGKPVDFYYAFKYPRSWHYAYLDSDKRKLEGMNGSLEKSTSPLSRTLDQLYKEQSSLTYAIWNDEQPDWPEGAVNLASTADRFNNAPVLVGGEDEEPKTMIYGHKELMGSLEEAVRTSTANAIAAQKAGNMALNRPWSALLPPRPDAEAPAPPPTAHAKGVVAFDGTTGFWLIHSVPKFPMKAQNQSTSKESYSERAASRPKYAQALLCISIGKETLKVIKRLLLNEELAIYDSADNAGVGVPGVDGKNGGPVLVEKVVSLGGQAFDGFSKSADWGQDESERRERQVAQATARVKIDMGLTSVYWTGETAIEDLYSDLIAKYFRRDFIAETWMNGTVGPANYCGEYKVMKARHVSFGVESWRNRDDHSKWAVSEDGAVFCLGGVNRHLHRFRPGGSMYCIEDAKIGRQMRRAINSYEECSPGRGMGIHVVKGKANADDEDSDIDTTDEPAHRRSSRNNDKRGKKHEREKDSEWLRSPTRWKPLPANITTTSDPYS